MTTTTKQYQTNKEKQHNTKNGNKGKEHMKDNK